jgi:ADP-heptose:LPS heptosyltransferase
MSKLMLTNKRKVNRFKEKKGKDRISVWITSLGLGDTICATPTIRKLKELYGNYKIDVYTYYPEIFTYNKNIDAVYFFEEEKELNGDYRNLRLTEYAKYFQTFSSTTVKPTVDHATTNIIDFCSIIALNQTLPDYEKWLEIPYTEIEKASLLEKIREFSIDFEKAIIIHPSKTWPTRTWPQENWVKLSEILTENGYQVIAVGSGKPVIERRRKLEGNFGIYKCPPKAINLIDRLTVLETIALLDLSKAVILMDSGLLHMAFATDISIIGMFTIVHPKFRTAWRKNGFNHKFSPVKPKGECSYCTFNKALNIGSYTICPKGVTPPCMPDVETVYGTFQNILAKDPSSSEQFREDQNRNLIQDKSINPTGGPMQQQNIINPDAVCQQAIQAKLNVYQAKEQFESILKIYNGQLDNLINLVGLMKNRILELEGELGMTRSVNKKPG